MVKIEVATHSGREHVCKVDEYDVFALQEKTNDNSIQTIAIGDRLFSRIDIKYIGPAEDEAE